MMVNGKLINEMVLEKQSYQVELYTMAHLLMANAVVMEKWSQKTSQNISESGLMTRRKVKALS
jgi:hypothetical protein